MREAKAGHCSKEQLGHMGYETLTLDVEGFVAHVALQRARKLNAFNMDMFRDLIAVFDEINDRSDIRCVVLSGGPSRAFSSGIDLSTSLAVDAEDPSRCAHVYRSMILHMQRSLSAAEQCRVPVIAAIHGACIGAGVDMISACDIRIASTDSFFSIKEIDLGLAADLGTLQRLPKIVGNASLVSEWAMTARRFTSDEALSAGLLSRVVQGSAREVLAVAMDLAKVIASKSPIAIAGTKRNLVYSRDHSVADGLDYIATWNSVMLQSSDVPAAVTASMSGHPAEYLPLAKL